MRFHPWALFPTVLYIGFVGWVTLGPQPYDSSTAGLLTRFFDFSQSHASTRWLDFSNVEGLANVAMFVPLGFFLALFLPRRAWLVAAVLCVLASTGIEMFQGAYLPTRVEDVRDIVHNGTGGLIGAVLAAVIRFVVAPRPRSRRLRTV
ncbi:VanZ family protein [Frondihabitans cladoniiphilus]|uniref:VanZ-like domain-containing protein n=1 Tax=Frondihabitans cladoniiphilus TaxID=715785 RepID=A0ABP8VS57_9MICO